MAIMETRLTDAMLQMQQYFNDKFSHLDEKLQASWDDAKDDAKHEWEIQLATLHSSIDSSTQAIILAHTGSTATMQSSLDAIRSHLKTVTRASEYKDQAPPAPIRNVQFGNVEDRSGPSGQSGNATSSVIADQSGTAGSSVRSPLSVPVPSFTPFTSRTRPESSTDPNILNATPISASRLTSAQRAMLGRPVDSVSLGSLHVQGANQYSTMPSRSHAMDFAHANNLEHAAATAQESQSSSTVGS